ncbi:MAG: IclR family transcriptional regulator [Parabacteroides sp.]|nr:IclR family transcriptional regulator [Parabacteroides sp.]
MIQVINRALNILELVSRERERDYSLGEIAKSLNLNASTCANIVKTLLNRGYLEQQEKKQGYKLGPQAYYLTGNYSNREELMRISVAPMQQLRDKLNETCILAILKENIRITLHKELSTHELQVVSNGEEKNAYLTATGRIVLACLKNDERMRFIQRYGLPGAMWPEVQNENDLLDELDKIKKKQLAIHFDGAYIVGVGSPIYKNDEVVAAIGIYLPEVRFTYKVQEQIFLEISNTAQLISNKMEKIL